MRLFVLREPHLKAETRSVSPAQPKSKACLPLNQSKSRPNRIQRQSCSRICKFPQSAQIKGMSAFESARFPPWPSLPPAQLAYRSQPTGPAYRQPNQPTGPSLPPAQSAYRHSTCSAVRTNFPQKKCYLYWNGQCSRRNWSGVVPDCLRKVATKWLTSRKPTSPEMVLTVIAGLLTSSSLLLRMRRRTK